MTRAGRNLLIVLAITAALWTGIYHAINWMVARSVEAQLTVLNAQAAEFDQRARALAEQQELMRQAIKLHDYQLRQVATSRAIARKTYAVEVTAYTCMDDTKRPGDPAYCQTAAGLHLRPAHNKRIVAADPRIFPAGTRLMIDGIGEVLVSDTGSAVKGLVIDLFWDEKDRAGALKFGRQVRTATVLEVGGDGMVCVLLRGGSYNRPDSH